MNRFRGVSRKFCGFVRDKAGRPIARTATAVAVGATALTASAQTTVTDIGLDISGLLLAYAAEYGGLLMVVLGIAFAVIVAVLITRKFRQHVK